MKKLFILFTILLMQNSFAQGYDLKKISSSTSIIFSESQMRGFEYQGTIYYVEDDLQTVFAVKKGKVIWRKNVILECEKSKASSDKIEMLKMHKGYLHAFHKNGDIWIEIDGSIFICGV